MEREMNIQTKVLSYDNRVRIFWTLCLVLLCTFVLYIYGINSTVHNTVTRQNLETEVGNLTVAISEMEYSYINLKNNVNIEVAYARGYQDVTSPTFITRGTSRSLSYNNLAR